ncbi:MAG: sulfocyanin-like copper-binding protein [Gemmatimonadota bacterium]
MRLRGARGPLRGVLNRAAVGLVLPALLWGAASGCGGKSADAGTGDGQARDAGESPTAEAARDREADGVRSGDSQESVSDLVEVNEFLAYDPADSLADLKLWAGYRGVNGAWSFDGFYAGNATIVMPLGWKVTATFQNLDANVPHSASVIEADDPVPLSGRDARIAFAGAATRAFTGGLSSREKPVTFQFVADREGRFRVYCGVPGHGPGGMWIWFEVSRDARVPDMRRDG